MARSESIGSSDDAAHDAAADGWADWEEASDGGADMVKCLYCAAELRVPLDSDCRGLVQHCATAHGVDLVQTVKDLSFYERIKFVNFARANVGAIADQPATALRPAFESDEFLKPAVADDPLLMLIHDLAELDVAGRSTAEQELAELKREFAEYKARTQQLLREQLDLGTDDDISIKPSTQASEPPELDGYFQSYCNIDIHDTMLRDRVRTEAYRDFIYENKHLFRGKVVLDIGCGTGILSMFAAKAGARRVVGVDFSDMADHARAIVRENGLDDVITIARAKIEEFSFADYPELCGIDKADIIISEWMGYFLLYEGMLDSVVSARDRLLAPGGLVCPSASTMYLAAFSSEAYYNDRYHFWEDVYGFKMRDIKTEWVRDAQIYDFASTVAAGEGDLLISDTCVLKSININKDRIADYKSFTKDFDFEITSTTAMHGFIGWFDVTFDDHRTATANNTTTVSLTTSPLTRLTHWFQAGLVFDKSLAVEQGQHLRGGFACAQRAINSRELVITIEFALVDRNGDGVAERKQSWVIR